MRSDITILIITYYWPPSGGVGVQRWMNYAVQLQRRGWKVMVLTPENPQFAIKDESLLNKVSDIPVFKEPIWEPFELFHRFTGNRERTNVKQGLVLEKSEAGIKDRLIVWIRGNLMIPDPRIFWLRKAFKSARDIITTHRVGYVVTTGPPHSMHLIGRKIKRAMPEVTWLADFRDPWSQWDILQKLHTSELVRSIHRKMEASILKEADICTTVSPRLAQDLGGLRVLHNGVSIVEESTSSPSDTFFTIGYFGLLNDLRNPQQLWLLLDQMCRENQVFANKLKVKIGGIVSEAIKKEIAQLHMLSNKVEFLGYLSHDQVQKAYQDCHILLLLQNKSNNADWILPVKFFEYLAARRMILCLGGRKSDLGDLINDKNIGQILEYTEVANIRSFVEEVFEKEKAPNEEDINILLDQFSHQRLVQKLESYLRHE